METRLVRLGEKRQRETEEKTGERALCKPEAYPRTKNQKPTTGPVDFVRGHRWIDISSRVLNFVLSSSIDHKHGVFLRSRIHEIFSSDEFN